MTRFTPALLSADNQPLLRPQPKPHYTWQTLALCSSTSARTLLPFEHALRLQVLPIRLYNEAEQQLLSVIMAAPHCITRIQELRYLTQSELTFDLEHDATLLTQAIRGAYQGSPQACEKALTEANNGPKDSSSHLPPLESKGPIPKLLVQLLHRAMLLGATDIHIEPFANCYRVRMRIQGVLKTQDTLVLEKNTASALIRRIRVLALVPVDTLTHCVEGSFECSETPRPIRIRVSVIPVYYGHKIVLRLLYNPLLEKQKTITRHSLEELGLTPPDASLLYASLYTQSGVILLSGPTGSGKSTLLSSCVGLLNDGSRNLVTIEDPIEHVIPGVNHTEVRDAHGMTFDSVLPKLLRQDPDVVMIGELRSTASTHCALTAGLSGSLILSSVHASNCLEILPRLEQLGARKQLIALSLRLLVSQRLLPQVCPHCREQKEASSSLRRVFNLPKQTVVAAPRGCSHCAGQGTLGVRGVFEMLPIQGELKHALLSGEHNPVTVKNLAFNQGYRPLAFHVRELLIEGVIAPHAALRCIGAPPEYETQE